MSWITRGLRNKSEVGSGGSAASTQGAARDKEFGMKVLVDKRPDEAVVDIIAIHGLNGHYLRTWTAETPTGNVNWLTDLLPHEMADARIMSYAYDSAVQFSKSVEGIDTFAEQLLEDLMSWRIAAEEKLRPIIFICHSLGGIVFKQALIRAHERERYTDLLSHIVGVMFFGTPHRGADLAKWGQIFGDVLKAASFGTSTNTRPLKELRSRSEILRKISESFVGRSTDLIIFSFYETEKMPNMGFKLIMGYVVEQDSSVLNLPNETKLGMSGNHRSICRFSTTEDQGYRNVWTSLQSMVGAALSKEEQTCRSSFRTSDYEFHKKRNEPPTLGTCQWILSHEKYKQFKESDSAELLWISADAGCGKSVLTSFLIDKTKSDTAAQDTRSPHLNICYFFFKDDSEEQRDASRALSAILHQIFCLQPMLLRHALEEQNANKLKHGRPFHTLWRIFENVIGDKYFSRTICFIDGLDECEPKSRSEFGSALAEYFGVQAQNAPANPRGNCLKVLLTSRPDNSIKEIFQDLPRVRLKGEDETGHISHDVEIVVKANLERLAKSGLPQTLLDRLQQRLIEGADRTFLWVTLIIKLLKDASRSGATEEDFEAIIQSRDIDAVYSRLLHGRPSPQAARKMLLIVFAAVRPLTIDEMCIAMSITKDKKQKTIRSATDINYNKWKEASSTSPGLISVRTKGIERLGQEIVKLDVRTLEDESPRRRRTARNMGGDAADDDIRNSLLPASTGMPDQEGTATELDFLGRKIKRPFENYIFTICGHFLRIIQNRIYLVHQTAKEFLTKPPLYGSLSPVESAFTELSDMKRLGAEKAPLQIWQKSILPEGANYIMLVICTEYLRLFAHPSEIRKRDNLGADAYKEFCRQDLVRGFLSYASLSWPLHYRKGYDFVLEPEAYRHYCSPDFEAFKIWTAEHPSFGIVFRPGRFLIPGAETSYSFEQELLEFFKLDEPLRSLIEEDVVANLELDRSSDDPDGESESQSTRLGAEGLSHRKQYELMMMKARMQGRPILDAGMSNPSGRSYFPPSSSGQFRGEDRL